MSFFSSTCCPRFWFAPNNNTSVVIDQSNAGTPGVKKMEDQPQAKKDRDEQVQALARHFSSLSIEGGTLRQRKVAHAEDEVARISDKFFFDAAPVKTPVILSVTMESETVAVSVSEPFVRELPAAPACATPPQLPPFNLPAKLPAKKMVKAIKKTSIVAKVVPSVPKPKNEVDEFGSTLETGDKQAITSSPSKKSVVEEFREKWAQKDTPVALPKPEPKKLDLANYQALNRVLSSQPDIESAPPLPNKLPQLQGQNKAPIHKIDMSSFANLLPPPPPPTFDTQPETLDEPALENVIECEQELDIVAQIPLPPPPPPAVVNRIKDEPVKKQIQSSRNSAVVVPQPNAELFATLMSRRQQQSGEKTTEKSWASLLERVQEIPEVLEEANIDLEELSENLILRAKANLCQKKEQLNDFLHNVCLTKTQKLTLSDKINKAIPKREELSEEAEAFRKNFEEERRKTLLTSKLLNSSLLDIEKARNK